MSLKPTALLLLTTLALLLTPSSPPVAPVRAAGPAPRRLVLFEAFMRPG